MTTTDARDLLLVIGNKNLSSWSLRPWLAMKHSGIAFRELVLLFEADGWRESIRGVSPSGRVPVLRDGDLVVWESLAICEHLSDAFPEARLWPEDRAARAYARAVSAEMHAGFASLRRDMSMDVVARAPKRTLSTETERDVARVVEIWSECRARHAASGPFLFGAFSIADAMFAPVVLRFRTYGVAIAERAARGWYDAMLALPAMREWERGAEAEVAAARRDAAARTASPAPSSPTSAQHAFAVVFSSQRRAGGDDAYETAAARMVELARAQPGFLGIESARGPDGFGLTVSYWDSLEAIRAWKDHPEHAATQAEGRASLYERYQVRVCRVDRGYEFPRKE